MSEGTLMNSMAEHLHKLPVSGALEGAAAGDIVGRIIHAKRSRNLAKKLRASGASDAEVMAEDLDDRTVEPVAAGIGAIAGGVAQHLFKKAGQDLAKQAYVTGALLGGLAGGAGSLALSASRRPEEGDQAPRPRHILRNAALGATTGLVTEVAGRNLARQAKKEYREFIHEMSVEALSSPEIQKKVQELSAKATRAALDEAAPTIAGSMQLAADHAKDVINSAAPTIAGSMQMAADQARDVVSSSAGPAGHLAGTNFARGAIEVATDAAKSPFAWLAKKVMRK